MRVFLRVLTAAVVGGSVSAYAQQYFEQEKTGDVSDLTFEPATTPMVVGTLAGLLAPRRYRLGAALVASALAALLRGDPLEEFLSAHVNES